MADIDNAVQREIENEMRIISHAPNRPALPTTQPKRKYIITPSIVSKVGVNTPPKVSNFLIVLDGLFIGLV